MKKALKRLTVVGLTGAILFGESMTAFAGAWKSGEEPNQSRWWYDFGNDTYAMNGWYWLDGNLDGIEECYYFDAEGWMLSDAITPDGYMVDANGAWTEHGVTQTRSVYEAEILASGLIRQEAGWGCMNEDGSPVRNDWRSLNGNLYYFDDNGCAVKGWQYIGEYKFYFNENTYDLVQNLDGILPIQTSYQIVVDRVRCQVTVYAPDGDNGYIIPCRTFICSPGKSTTPTPAGTFATTAKYRWHLLQGPSYGQYCTRIGGRHILFHSVPGRNATSYNLSAHKYNMLGEPASAGCIRMTVADAKWIYDNCGIGTVVTIGDNLPAPFEKPEGIKIPEGQTWDPTDPAIQ